MFGKVKIEKTGMRDEVEFRLDDYVAYGTFEHSEHGLPVYSVDHGPTQGDVDAIASALDEAFDAVECTSMAARIARRRADPAWELATEYEMATVTETEENALRNALEGGK